MLCLLHQVEVIAACPASTKGSLLCSHPDVEVQVASIPSLLCTWSRSFPSRAPALSIIERDYYCGVTPSAMQPLRLHFGSGKVVQS